MPSGFILSEQDQRILEELLRAHKDNRSNATLRVPFQIGNDSESYPSRTYIGYLPCGESIPPFNPETKVPGWKMIDVYAINNPDSNDSDKKKLVPLNFQEKVWTLST